MAFGKTITIFWVDGTPDGIITGELSGWNGKCIKLPRDQINAKRDELEYPGVYFLICTDTKDGEDAVYIGETDNLKTRLVQHVTNYKMKKENFYWQNVVAFSSDSLNKALVKYLENRLVEIAKESKRYKVLTKASSPKIHIKEHEIDSMEQFIVNMKTILTALNYRILDEPPSATHTKESHTMFFLNTKDANGSGYLTNDNKFLLTKGSSISPRTTQACSKAALRKRETLIEEGLIKDNVLTDDLLLNSSSLAASLITGFSTSGPEWWKTEEGISLKEIQMK